MSKSPYIHIPQGVIPWPHELKVVTALVRAGYKVAFLGIDHSHRRKTADIVIDDIIWEIKSPLTANLPGIERNLKRASKQSPDIIIDSCRTKKLRDQTIQRFLQQKLLQQKSIHRILFINRKREIIDIKPSGR